MQLKKVLSKNFKKRLKESVKIKSVKSLERTLEVMTYRKKCQPKSGNKCNIVFLFFPYF